MIIKDNNGYYSLMITTIGNPNAFNTNQTFGSFSNLGGLKDIYALLVIYLICICHNLTPVNNFSPIINNFVPVIINFARLIEGTQAPILYTGLGVWKVLSFQEMMEED